MFSSRCGGWEALAPRLLDSGRNQSQGQVCDVGFVFSRRSLGILLSQSHLVRYSCWKLGQTSTEHGCEEQGARLLERIWAEIEGTFEAGDAGVRVELFKTLKEAALFQPVRVLKLIRRALENEAATVVVWADWEIKQEDVLREIPPLLQAIALHFDHLEEAAGILWELVQRDRRSPRQYPHHARHVLDEMAEYGRYKPVIYNDWMAEFAARMCGERNAFDGEFTPLDIVDKLLAKEGQFTESEGFTISFGGFGLNYPVVRPVREKALGVIKNCLNSEDPKIAMRATESTARVLSGYLPMIGHVVSEEEARWQMDERLAVAGHG